MSDAKSRHGYQVGASAESLSARLWLYAAGADGFDGYEGFKVELAGWRAERAERAVANTCEVALLYRTAWVVAR